MFKFVQIKNEKTDYLVGGDWSELKKTWNKYNKALVDQNIEKIKQYADKINHLQEKLGIQKTDFT